MTYEDMIERAARALFGSHSVGDPDAAWDGAGEITRNNFRQQARIALEASWAMRFRQGLDDIGNGEAWEDAPRYARQVLDGRVDPSNQNEGPT